MPSAPWVEHTSYDAIGTNASPVTLTGAFANNLKVLEMKYLGNLHLDIKYTPNAASTNAYLMVLIEYSNDDGTNFYPRSTSNDSTTETDVYVTGVNSTSGIPLIVPGDKVTTGGTTYKISFDGNVLATHVRISVREAGQTSFGTAYIRASFLG